MIFRLRGGCHVEGDKVYRKGELIVTDVDLTKTFRGKFDRVWSPEQLSPAELKAVIHLFPEYRPPKVEQPAIPRPTPSGEGDAAVTASPEPDVVDAAQPIEEIDQSPELPDDDEQPIETEAETDDDFHPEWGKLVSDQFPEAAEVGLNVYFKANWYNVLDPDDGVRLNEKSLRKRDVSDFLASYKK